MTCDPSEVGKGEQSMNLKNLTAVVLFSLEMKESGIVCKENYQDKFNSLTGHIYTSRECSMSWITLKK